MAALHLRQNIDPLTPVFGGGGWRCSDVRVREQAGNSYWSNTQALTATTVQASSCFFVLLQAEKSDRYRRLTLVGGGVVLMNAFT
jgi:hypothetical protein